MFEFSLLYNKKLLAFGGFLCYYCQVVSRCGGMADATDSKSVIRKGVRVRVSPPAVSCMIFIQLFYCKNIVSNRI